MNKFSTFAEALHFDRDHMHTRIRIAENHRITESQNHIGWKRPLRSSSPTINLTLPRPPLHHVSKYLIQMSFKYLQGWRLNHFPGQSVPMLDNPLGEEKFPNIQSKPPLAQLEAISSCPITCYLGEETDPHLSTTSFQAVVESDKVSPQPPFLQAKQSQLPQPLLIRLLLQTLHQLRCPSLYTLQYLNIPLVVGGPKLNTKLNTEHREELTSKRFFPPTKVPNPTFNHHVAVISVYPLIALLTHKEDDWPTSTTPLDAPRARTTPQFHHLQIYRLIKIAYVRMNINTSTNDCDPHVALGQLWEPPTLLAESQNHIGWKRPLRSSSPTINLTLPRPPLHHVPKHLIQTPFKYLQGWRLNPFPGQPVPMLDNPFSEEKFPNIQSKPPLAQLEAISSCPITCYLGEETNPHLSTTSFQVAVESDEVSPQPPFLQAKQPQLPQPLLIRLLLQTLHQLRCPSLDTLQPLNIPLVVGGPKLNTVFEVKPHQCRVQGHDHFPSPAGHAIFDTSQDAIGFLGHLGTLLAHIQPAVNQHPQVLLCQAAFQPLFPKPAALHGVAVAQVQDLALGLVKPHTIHPSPSIQPVQVPLQSLPTLQQINTPTQLGVICKLTESTLDPFVQIIDKDVKQNWPQHRALGNTACDRPPTGVNSTHHHSLGPAVQPVLYHLHITRLAIPEDSTTLAKRNAQLYYPPLHQEEEFAACYGSENPPPPAGNPFCLTHSHPDANAKVERCYKES
ncbi:hypothetical protein QYF61_000027, partial [Mycteria americana]